jgi:hypothetical protein
MNRTFSPGDRVSNRHMHGSRHLYGDWLGTVVDDPDTEQGTVAVTWDFSSQIWYVNPFVLDLVAPAEQMDEEAAS